MRARWLIIAGIFVGALVWLWRSAQEDPAPVQPSAPSPEQAPQPARRSTVVVVPKAQVVMPAKQSTFDATTHHTADPCTALVEPIVPATFESITAAGITVAWDAAEAVGPYDAPFRPVALAFTVAGILEEAGQLTGTDRRQQLTVIVDATPDDFRLRMKAPAWVGGLYDGGSVHVPAKMNADLGVMIAVLRHEVMHAQIHAAIGCVPFWFNEGIANYFAGITPTREWFGMMRGDAFDMTRLKDPAIFDVRADDASRMYAVSLAMVLYIVHHAGEQGLRDAARVAQTSKTPLDLWEQITPHGDYHAVVDSLAQKVFGMPLGGDLDALVKGSVCCRNLRTPAELSCHAPAAETVKREICRRW